MIKIWLLILIIYGNPVVVGEYTSKDNCHSAQIEFHKNTNVLKWPFRVTRPDSGCISILKEKKN